MNVELMNVYPKNEIRLHEKLYKLLDQWHEEAESMKFIKRYTADDMVYDGFYPYYTKQKKKILFIGREALGLNGEDYIECVYNAYKTNKIGNKHINQYKFHRLMFYLAYCIINNFPAWGKVPYASELTEDFGTEKGISFAFMNLSKFSNESGKWSADWELIDSFINNFTNTETNYFNDEISILKPDIIITMNLENRLNVLGRIDSLKYGSKASCYYLMVNRKKIPLIDLYHFSATNKKDKEEYYLPLKDAIKIYSKVV